MGGNVVYLRGDKWIIRTIKRTFPRNTYIMWGGNYLFSTAAEHWNHIKQSAWEEWTKYKAYIGYSRSGLNPWVKNWCQLFYPSLLKTPGNASTSLFGTKFIEDITSPPEYPAIPSCFYAAYDIEFDGINYEWLDDYEHDTIIEAGYYNAPGRARPPKEWMRIGKGDLSTREEIFLTGDKFNPGRITYASVRSVNLRGEVSEWHDPIEIDVPDKPSADFSGAPRKGLSPLEVDFLNLTQGLVTSYLWNFGDGMNSIDKNPTHIFYGIPGDAFTIRLTAFGKTESKNKKTRYDYIKITTECDFPAIFICDSSNNRIHERSPLDFLFVFVFGSLGSQIGYFNYPFGIAMDKYFLYITDYVNCRLLKRIKYEDYYVQEVGTEGSGDTQFQYPAGIAINSDRLYICDRYNSRLIKLKKSDLSFVLKACSHGVGNDELRWPTGIAADDDHVYICDNGNHRIMKRTSLLMEYVSKIGSLGSGNDEFNDPYGIAVDDNFLYICDTYNHRLVKRLKSDLMYFDQIGSEGAGDDQFNLPKGIVTCGDFLYIADTGNNRVVKRLKEDLSFVCKLGSAGTGDDQFNDPIGLCVLKEDPLPDLVAWYLFKTAGYDVGNSRFTDQTGNEHHAANFGATVHADYTVFDGNDYCEIEDFKEISGNFKRFSMAIWVKFTLAEAGTLCSHYDDLDADIQPSWWSIIQSDGKHSHRVYGDNILVLRKDYISSNPVNDDEWHLLGFTFNDNTFEIFCDSVKDPDPNKYLDHIFSTLTDSTAKFLVGARYWQSMVADHYTGKISKMYFFNEAITQCDWIYLMRLGH